MTRPPLRLGNARCRLRLGLTILVLTRLALRPDTVGPVERRLFRQINGLPDAPAAPIWVSMQPGALGAVPIAAGAALLSGRPALSRRLLLAGAGAWGVSKLVKLVTARPRPGELLSGTHQRGRPQTGLGYVSGHAGVVTSMCVAALPELPPAARAAALFSAAGVAFGRVYTGAHLPLDIAGGIGLGLAVEAAVEMTSRPPAVP